MAIFENQMDNYMMPYSKIKKYYFTVCVSLLALLLVLMLLKNNWTVTPRALLSTLVGWLVICAVIIGVIYMLVVKRGTGKHNSSSGDDTSGEDRITG